MKDIRKYKIDGTWYVKAKDVDKLLADSKLDCQVKLRLAKTRRIY